MHNILLSVHIIISVCLIGIVLMQRSEGGGLGIGGGGGDGMFSQRGAATALTKMTWALATGFLLTSLLLTISTARSTGSNSVLDSLIGGSATETTVDGETAPSDGEALLPPTTSSGDDTLVPPAPISDSGDTTEPSTQN